MAGCMRDLLPAAPLFRAEQSSLSLSLSQLKAVIFSQLSLFVYRICLFWVGGREGRKEGRKERAVSAALLHSSGALFPITDCPESGCGWLAGFSPRLKRAGVRVHNSGLEWNGMGRNSGIGVTCTQRGVSSLIWSLAGSVRSRTRR